MKICLQITLVILVFALLLDGCGSVFTYNTELKEIRREFKDSIVPSKVVIYKKEFDRYDNIDKMWSRINLSSGSEKMSGRIILGKDLNYSFISNTFVTCSYQYIQERYKDVLVVFNEIEKKVELQCSVQVKSRIYRGFVTDNYFYIPVVVNGNYDLYSDNYENFESGIVVSRRENPNFINFFRFELEDIVSVKQKGDNLEIITCKVAPIFDFDNKIMNDFSKHFRRGYWVSTSGYKIYTYDRNLELISIQDTNVELSSLGDLGLATSEFVSTTLSPVGLIA